MFLFSKYVLHQTLWKAEEVAKKKLLLVLRDSEIENQNTSDWKASALLWVIN